jgi:hypothetical protein
MDVNSAAVRPAARSDFAISAVSDFSFFEKTIFNRCGPALFKYPIIGIVSAKSLTVRRCNSGDNSRQFATEDCPVQHHCAFVGACDLGHRKRAANFID